MFPNVYEPDQVKMLSTVLEEYCAARGVTTADDREDVALRLIGLFDSGATTVEVLRAGLDDADQSVRAAERCDQGNDRTSSIQAMPAARAAESTISASLIRCRRRARSPVQS
ncbi:hypothetical protein [Arvimicrobium flavum]|uniref:hypothetical protein n=1 Tax=Arvimicrobium flavum TaxID=3393320 RepID=UPI00237B10DB|nr:hypothetical protein [Mesorhizobium shangrilense]